MPHPTLSLDHAAARHDLSLLVLATGAFFLGGALFSGRGARLYLCAALAGNGVALAFFGLVQQLTWNGKLFWRVAVRHEAASFASYVDRNNAAGYLLICLAGAIGLALMLSHSKPGKSATQTAEGAQRPSAHSSNRIRELLGWLDAPRLAAVGAIGMIMAGILCSLSRGGALAMIVAGLVVGALVLFTQRRVSILYVATLVVAGGLLLVGWIGATETVGGRLATLLRRDDVASDGRWAHWRDGTHAASDFWLTGSGLGTYRDVYLPYQQRFDHSWYYHAENQYLESLVEAGVPGLALLLGAIGLVALAAWRIMRPDWGPEVYGLGVAAMFALVAQVVQSAVDFGLYLPANMLALALLCGAAAGRAAKSPGHGWQGHLIRLGHQRSAVMIAGVALAAGCLWGGAELWRAAATEAAVGSAPLNSAGPDTSPELLRQAIERCDAALLGRPDDAETQLQVAQLWILLYRREKLEQLSDANRSVQSRETLWAQTETTALHRRLHQLLRADDDRQLAALRQDPLVTEQLLPAVEHLVRACRANPLLPEAHLALAEIGGLRTDWAADDEHLERAAELAPGDPEILFRCGLLHLQAGRPVQACACWQTCLTLTDTHAARIRELCQNSLSAEQVVQQVMPRIPERLVTLGKSWFAGPDQGPQRQRLAKRLAELVASEDLTLAEQAYYQGVAAQWSDDLATAARQYSRALELDPGNAPWRFEFAQVLQQQGRLDDAYEQARWSLRLKPEQAEYERYVQRLRLQRTRSSM